MSKSGNDLREQVGAEKGRAADSETATAQQLKAQYGSVRIRERQGEMIRLSRDMSRIAGEIIAENFAAQSLLDMSQVNLPTAADIQMMMQQAMMQAQASGQPMQQPPKMPVSIDQVDALLKSQRMRPFILEIETDSTIQPDEDADAGSADADARPFLRMDRRLHDPRPRLGDLPGFHLRHGARHERGHRPGGVGSS